MATPTLNPITKSSISKPKVNADGSNYICTWSKPTAAKGTTLKGYWIRWWWSTVDNPARWQYEDSQIDDVNVTISYFSTSDLYTRVQCSVYATYTVDKKTKYSARRSSPVLNLRYKLNTPEVPSLEYVGNDSRQGKATVSGYTPESETYKANWIIIRIYQWDANNKSTTIDRYLQLGSPYPDSVETTFSLVEGCTYRVKAAAYYSKNVTDGAKAWKTDYVYYSDFSELSDAASPLYGPPPAPVGGIEKLAVHTSTSVRVYWAGLDAYKYQIEYTTDSRLFDTGAELSSVTTSLIGMKYIDVTGLDTGNTYYFRIRSVHSTAEGVYSDWSSVKSCTLGTKPSPPTTWALSSTIDSTQDAKLYWSHNSTDNSQLTKSRIELTDGVNTPVLIDQNRMYSDENGVIHTIHRYAVTKSGDTYTETTTLVSDRLKGYLVTTTSGTTQVPVLTTNNHEVYRIANVVETGQLYTDQNHDVNDTTNKVSGWVTDQGRDVYLFNTDYTYWDGTAWCFGEFSYYNESSPEEYFFVDYPNLGSDDTIAQFLVLGSGSREIPVRVEYRNTYTIAPVDPLEWDDLYAGDRVFTGDTYSIYKCTTQNSAAYSEKYGPFYAVTYDGSTIVSVKQALCAPSVDSSRCLGFGGEGGLTKITCDAPGYAFPDSVTYNGVSYPVKRVYIDVGYINVYSSATGGTATRYPSSGFASIIRIYYTDVVSDRCLVYPLAYSHAIYTIEDVDRPYASIGRPSKYTNDVGNVLYKPLDHLHIFDVGSGFREYQLSDVYSQTSENVSDLVSGTETAVSGVFTDTGMQVYTCTGAVGLYYVKYQFNEDIHWRVKTMGLLINNSEDASFSDWSIMRQLKIYTKPQVALTLADVVGEDEHSYTIEQFPINVYASVTPVNSSVQNPVSYSFKITSLSEYETTDETGAPRMVFVGDVMYSKVIISSDISLTLAIQAEDVLLMDNMTYSIDCRVGMSSGLVADTEIDGGSLLITPSWGYSEYQVGFGIEFETEFCTASIAAECYDMVDTAYSVTRNGSTYTRGSAMVSVPDGSPYMEQYYLVSGEEALEFTTQVTPTATSPAVYTRAETEELVYYYTLDQNGPTYYCVKRGNNYYPVSQMEDQVQFEEYHVDSDEEPLILGGSITPIATSNPAIYTSDETSELVYYYTIDQNGPTYYCVKRGNDYYPVYATYYSVWSYVQNGQHYYTVVSEASDTISSTGVISVYRINTDNTFTHIASGSVGAISCTDPHPILTTAAYRVVVQNKDTGVVQFDDFSEETHFPNDSGPDYEYAILLQWNETFVTYESDQNESSNPPYSGSFLALPYDVDISDNYQPDAVLVEYAGAEEPQSYYGTQKGHTATWQCNVIKKDLDTLMALRRLSRYSGDVYVREPSGSGYWANISVSFSQTHAELVIPVTLNVTKVRGGA